MMNIHHTCLLKAILSLQKKKKKKETHDLIVSKIPETVKSQHGSSDLVTEVNDVDDLIDVDEKAPVMKLAAANWTVCGHVQSSDEFQSNTRLKAPPAPCPVKTMPYVSVHTAHLFASWIESTTQG
jgi:hypothetical protein